MEITTTTKTFAFFENHQSDQFEVHAPNCGCIKKYITQMVIDTSNVHTMNATTANEAKETIIAEYGYNDGGDDEITVKVFPCTTKGGN
jgi:hypothetical protein